jgi:hypothetical protein
VYIYIKSEREREREREREGERERGKAKERTYLDFGDGRGADVAALDGGHSVPRAARAHHHLAVLKMHHLQGHMVC